MIRQNTFPESKRGVADSLGDVVGDVATLAELQLNLFKLDCLESRRQLAVPVIAVSAGALLLAGLFPVTLLFCAALIHEFASLSVTASLAIATSVGFIFSVAVLFFGFHSLAKALKFFARSREELKRNIEWLKNLKHRNKRFSP